MHGYDERALPSLSDAVVGYVHHPVEHLIVREGISERVYDALLASCAPDDER